MDKKCFVWFITGILCIAGIFCSGCGRKGEQGEVIAKVNSYNMTVEDFEDELKYSHYAGIDTADKERLLDAAIRKQLLIQEAQRRGLDRKKTFMKTIERYWEQTLIKELMEEETQRVHKSVPGNKQEQALNDWMEGLYKKADIKINKKALDKVK